MSRKKWAKGRRIRSLDELMRQKRIYWDPGFVGVKRPIVDCGWFKSWQLNYAANQVGAGHCFAVRAGGGFTK